jgi:3,4-dihydroxy 2-butanone 4-phosphate synthase/GTP cyclohydrolase II
VRNTLSDVLHLRRDDLGLTVTAALRRIDEEGRGVVVVLSEPGEAETLLDTLAGEPVRKDSDAANEWRQNGLGAQILADLGVRHLRVLGTPRKLVGLAGFDLDIVGYEDVSSGK